MGWFSRFPASMMPAAAQQPQQSMNGMRPRQQGATPNMAPAGMLTPQAGPHMQAAQQPAPQAANAAQPFRFDAAQMMGLGNMLMQQSEPEPMAPPPQMQWLDPYRFARR